MEENNYNNTEKLFRDKLKNASEADWNTPPDFIFEKAMSVVNEDKKKRRPIFWFLFSGISLLVLISSFYLFELNFANNTENDSNGIHSFISDENTSKKEAELIELKSDLIHDDKNNIKKSKIKNAVSNDNISQGFSVIQGNTSSNNQVPGNTNAVISSQQIILPNKKSNVIQLSKNIKLKGAGDNITYSLKSEKQTSLVNESILPSKVDAVFDGNINNASENTSLNNNYNGKKEIRERHVLNSNLMKMPVVKLGQFNRKFQDLNRFRVELDERTLDDNRAWSAYFLLSYNMSSMQMKNALPSLNSLTEYDKYYAGYGLGFGLEKKLSKRFKIDIQLAISRLKNKSRFKEKMNYDSQNEQLNGLGQKIYETEMNIETPMGILNETARFPVDGFDLTDGDEMLGNTLNTQNYFIYSTAVGLAYKIWERRKMKISMRAALSGNYISNVNSEMQMNVYFSGNMMMDKKSESKEMNDLKRFYSAVYSGLNVEHSFSNKLSLGVNMGYERSLNSIRKANISTDPKTFINNFNSGLRLSYKF